MSHVCSGKRSGALIYGLGLSDMPLSWGYETKLLKLLFPDFISELTDRLCNVQALASKL